MDTVPRVDARPLAMPTRRWRSGLSSTHILIFAAGALAFVANLALLRPDAPPPGVAVAAIELLPGSVLDSSRDLKFVPMSTAPSVLEEFVLEAWADLYDGHVVTERVGLGSPVRLAALTSDSSIDRRIMSVAVDRGRAVGGTLVVGDTVDVIVVDGSDARYVATGLEVVGVPESSGSSSGYHLVLAVDPDMALELSAAVGTAGFQVVRASGRR